MKAAGEKEMDRREFLICGCAAIAIMPFQQRALSRLVRLAEGRTRPPESNSHALHGAMFWEPGESGSVVCRLCFRSCNIKPGARGFCRIRVNRDGGLHSLTFGNMAAVTYGPVEKKPLHHYLPGSLANNYGTAGCNLRCKFCHNWHLSQRRLEDVGRYESLTPAEAVGRAKRRNAALLSFTYNEPAMFYEFMLPAAALAREEGLGVNVNTNAVMREQPMRKLLETADSFTVDLKGFSESFYRDVCAGKLAPVLDNIRLIGEAGAWMEIVNLVIPGLNDDPVMIRNMCRWVRENAGPDTPVHFNRFSPAYKLTDVSSTPVRSLERARDIALAEGINYVYIGNVPGHRNNSTFCPGCGEKVIDRHHFSVRKIGLENGRCANCNRAIAGVWGK